MQLKAFSHWLSQIEKLTPAQKREGMEALQSSSQQTKTFEVLEEVHSCPHCLGIHYQKWGVRSGLQRYRCRECGRTFNALSSTPLARLRHKEVWLDFLNTMMEGDSIRQSAKVCGVNKNTTFRWRHRMLNNPRHHEHEALQGIVEFDETYFLHSDKGDPHLQRPPRKRGGRAKRPGISSEQTAVLILRDRHGATRDALLYQSNQKTLAEVLLPQVEEDALLCSDAKGSYRAFARTYHRTLKVIKAKGKHYVKERVYHLQNVNAYDSRLKAWMQRFHGVATRYLESYLGWRRLLDTQKDLSPETFLGIVARRGLVCQPLKYT
jgi:transposase-like protein